jgi:hypothetical protein
MKKLSKTLLMLLFFPLANLFASDNEWSNPTLTPPNITQCPRNIEVNMNSNACNATLPNMLGTFLATDNCPTPTTLTYSQSPVAGTTLTGGHNATHTITFTVTDNCGQSSTCTAVVTLKDRSAPNLVCQSRTVALISRTASITTNDVLSNVTDNCTATNDLILSLNKSTFTCADLYVSPVNVELTATDLAGNATTCLVSITVQDNAGFCPTPPTITQCPADFSVIVDNNCSFVVPNLLANFQATNHCPTGSLTYSQSPTAGTNYCCATSMNITFTATDACGVSSICTTRVTMRDVKKPEVNCHNKIIDIVSGTASITVGDILNSAFDNCTPSNMLTLSLSKNTFTCNDMVFNPYPITLTAIDAAGNSNFCVVSLTLQSNDNSCQSPVLFGGNVKTEGGVAIPNVEVSLFYQATLVRTIITTSNGLYDFNVIPNLNYTLNFKKNTNFANGVTHPDAVAIGKHISNNTPLSSPYKVLAANVTENDISGSTVNVLDKVMVLQLINGNISSFPASSWTFVPANHVFNTPSPTNAFPSPLPPILPFTINVAAPTTYNVIGVKKGDADGDADPNQ